MRNVGRVGPYDACGLTMYAPGVFEQLAVGHLAQAFADGHEVNLLGGVEHDSILATTRDSRKPQAIQSLCSSASAGYDYGLRDDLRRKKQAYSGSS